MKAKRKSQAESPDLSDEGYLRHFSQVTSRELSHALGALMAELEFALANPQSEIKNQAIEAALSMAEHSAALSRNLHFFSEHTQIGSGVVDVSQLVLDTIDIVERDLNASGLELVVFVQAGVLFRTDAGAFQQVLLSLLFFFATRVSSGRVAVTLKATQQEGLKLICGHNEFKVTPEEIDTLFTSAQANDLYSEAGGMGLALSKALVEAQGGNFVISSGDNGTSFEVIFPHAKLEKESLDYVQKRRFRRVSVALPIEIRFSDSSILHGELISLSQGGGFVLFPEGEKKRLPAVNTHFSVKITYFNNKFIEVEQSRTAHICRIGMRTGIGIEFMNLGTKAKQVIQSLARSHVS